MVASTPPPPYTAVIFTSVRTDRDPDDGYDDAAAAMESLAALQPGYLGIESVRNVETGEGITVSYWTSDAHAQAWKRVSEHRLVQQKGRDAWYERYSVRVAEVHRDYSSSSAGSG